MINFKEIVEQYGKENLIIICDGSIVMSAVDNLDETQLRYTEKAIEDGKWDLYVKVSKTILHKISQTYGKCWVPFCTKESVAIRNGIETYCDDHA